MHEPLRPPDARGVRTAKSERGPNTIFAFELEGARVCHFGDFGQRELREEQAGAIGRVDILFVPVGAGPAGRGGPGGAVRTASEGSSCARRPAVRRCSRPPTG